MKRSISAFILTLLVVPTLYVVFFVLNKTSDHLAPPINKTAQTLIEDDLTKTEETTSAYKPQLAISEIEDDLALIKETSQSTGAYKPRYFDIGTVNNGTYKGHKIIVMIKNYPLTSDALITTFITKDDKSYLSQDKLTKESFNATKVRVVNDLGLNHPTTLVLNDTYTLFKQGILTDYIYTGSKDTNDTLIYQTVISGDTSRTEKLGKLGELDVSGYQESSEILLTDQSGITYIYSLGFTSATNTPKTHLTKQDIKFIVPTNTYDTYGTAVPTDCANNIYTKIAINYNQNKLKKIGAYKNSDIFIYNDTDFYLMKDQFQSKIATQMFGNDTDFANQNKVSRPNYETYLQKLPVIFIKDYWDRLLALGEHDFKMINRCD